MEHADSGSAREGIRQRLTGPIGTLLSVRPYADSVCGVFAAAKAPDPFAPACAWQRAGVADRGRHGGLPCARGLVVVLLVLRGCHHPDLDRLRREEPPLDFRARVHDDSGARWDL